MRGSSMCAVIFGVYILGAGSAISEPVCQRKLGEMVCSKGEVTVMNTSGILKMNGTHVQKKLGVKGQATISNSQVKDLKVFGEAVLINTEIKGKADILGFLNAYGSIFRQTVIICTNYMRAVGSTFADVIVDSGAREAELLLSKNSVVKGDIVFKGRSGVVVLASGSVVTGKIINGKKV